MTHPVSGFIEVVCGSMFSGKTEELLRRIKRAHIARQKVQVFKPSIDNRYSDTHVQSHDATRVASIPVRSAKEILDHLNDNTRVVGIDEAQFFDDLIVEVVDKLAYRGIRVIVAGLDMDYMGRPFGPMPKLLAIAEKVTKLTAICTACGASATRSQRIGTQKGLSTTDQVLVGAQDSYEARCRFHHDREIESSHASQMGLPTFLVGNKITVSEKNVENS